jgi:hypothetical protein
VGMVEPRILSGEVPEADQGMSCVRNALGHSNIFQGTRCEIMSSFPDEANHVKSFERQSHSEKCPTRRQQRRRLSERAMIRVGLTLEIFRIRGISLIGTSWIWRIEILKA